MKKIILGVSMIALASVVYAAPTAMAGSSNGSKHAITAALCPMISGNNTANIQLSADVEGNYDCSATNAGVGTAHPKGKGKSYSASSNGGSIKETSATAEFAATSDAAAAAAAAATAGMNAS